MATNSVKLAKVSSPLETTTFEHLIVKVSARDISTIVVLVYRPGSQNITQQFFTELSQLFAHLSSSPTPFVVTGDLNIRLDRPTDSHTVQFTDVMSAFNLVQHVQQPTHQQGGILDVVITLAEATPRSVEVVDIGVSDHKLLLWPVHGKPRSSPNYVTRRQRSWRSFDFDAFSVDLQSSALCDATRFSEFDDVDAAAEMFNTTISELLDRHAPTSEVTVRLHPRTDQWFDNDCRKARRRTRKLERRFHRFKSDTARHLWRRSLFMQRKLFDQKRAAYWQTEILHSTSPRHLWRSIDKVLCRNQASSCDDRLSAGTFSDYFQKKISDIRASTAAARPPSFTLNTSGMELPEFQPLSVDQVIKLITETPSKQSALDPMPTWLLKQCAEPLAPFITLIFNLSLTTGCVPSVYKMHTSLH